MDKPTFHLDIGNIFKLEKTPEGYLNCHARVARVGDLEYLNPDGTKRIERVTPEVLFNKDSYNTLKMKPVTVPEHPPVLLDSTNCTEYAKGCTSNIITIDGSFLGVVLTVTDQDAIAAIENGVTEVSCGYMASTRALPDGSFQQLNRDYNHLAIVPRGRAGRDVRITMDSCELPIIHNIPTETPMSVILKIDEHTSVELPPEIAAKVSQRFKNDSDIIESLKSQCDSLSANIAGIQELLTARNCSSVDELLAKYDNLTETLSNLTSKLDSLPQSVDVTKLLQARRQLERKCEGLLPDNFNLDTASDRDLMIAVLSRNTKLSDFSNLSDTYITARFDGVVENQELVNTSAVALQASNLGTTSNNSQSNLSEIEKLRLDMEAAKAEYQNNFVIIK